MPSRLVIGCMTGTSIDGLDAAIVAIEGKGLDMTARVEGTVTTPLGDIGLSLRSLAEQQPMAAEQIAVVAHDFVMLHVEACRELVGSRRADLVCVHGQTVFHRPPLSWQLMSPAPIARALGVPVCFDLRAADLAAGGQGAPITPIADSILFGQLEGSWAVANLGGFCNISLGPTGRGRDHGGGQGERVGLVEGMDVCACNQLLDDLARELLGRPYDAGGEHALSGRVDDDAMKDLCGVLSGQSGGGRSLGTGDEVGDWVARHRARCSPADLAASACDAIAGTIAEKIGEVDRVFLAGGGTKNLALLKALKRSCRARVGTTDEVGVPSSHREAVCMAILGALCQDRVPITLRQVTKYHGAPFVSGAWMYP